MVWYLRALFGLPALAVFLVYRQALNFGYLWDDQLILLRSPHMHRDWATLLQHLGEPFLTGLSYFRPLPLLTLGAEQLLFGGSPFVPHLDAVLLHAANATLVAILAALLCRHFAASAGRSAACGVIAGMFYGLHPALLESAAWISVRFDALMTFFCLLALISDRVFVGRRARVVAVGSMFFAAALCKEMALGWALLLPWWHSMFSTRPRSWSELLQNSIRDGHAAVYAAVTVAGLAYLALRLAFHGQPIHPSATSLDAGQHAALILKSFGKYLELSLWPFPAVGHLHYLKQPIQFADRELIAGLIGLATLPLLAWHALRRGPDWRTALPCCFAVALLPVLNLIPLQLGDNYVQDRFLALPVVFVSLAVALLLRAALHAQRAQLVAAGLAFIGCWLLLSLLNIGVRLPNWRDNLSFAFMEHAREPESHSGALDLQQAYLQSGMAAQARTLSEQLAKQKGGRLFPPQRIGYGRALADTGELEQGIAEIETALAQLPAIPENAEWTNLAYGLIGELYLRHGEPERAAQYLRQALAESDSAETRYFLALAEISAGRPEAGRQLMDRALEDAPAMYREARRAQVPARLEAYRAAAEKLSGSK